MTKKTRTILFLICLILFLTILPAVIFYSQGYRFDFERKKITQTGAFYFKVWPKDVQIYLNDRLAKKTDFFFGTAFLENLLPKKYKIEIKKSGFYSWEKTLEIKEKQVTEAKNVILIPVNFNFAIIDKDIENFFFSPNYQKIILKTKITSDKKQSWALEFFDLKNNLKSHLIEEKDILTKKKIKSGKVEILDLKFSPDLKIVYLTLKLNEKVNYFTLEIDKTPPPLKEVKELLPFVEKDPRISPDLKKNLEFNDYEIWILFLEDDLSALHHKGDKIFLTRFSEKIEKISWLNSYYLIFNLKNKIKIAEIDDRDKINIYDIAEFPNLQFFWNQYDKKIYLLSQGNLIVSEKILP